MNKFIGLPTQQMILSVPAIDKYAKDKNGKRIGKYRPPKVVKELDYDELLKQSQIDRSTSSCIDNSVQLEIELQIQLETQLQKLFKEENVIGSYLGYYDINKKLIFCCIKKIEKNQIYLYQCNNPIKYSYIDEEYYVATDYQIILTYFQNNFYLNNGILANCSEIDKIEIVAFFNYKDINVNTHPNWTTYYSLNCRIAIYCATIPKVFEKIDNETILGHCNAHIESQAQLEDFDSKMFKLTIIENKIYYYCNLFNIENGNCNKYYVNLYNVYAQNPTNENGKELINLHRMSQLPRVAKSFSEYFVVNIDEEVLLNFDLIEVR